METILLVPEYSHEIRGSIMQVTQGFLRHVATRDDIHLVVPYPKEGSRWKNWRPEKWEVEASNIEYVPVLMDKYSECALGRVSTDWANSKFGGRKDYLVVATMRSTSPIGIRRLFAKPMAGFYPEIVNLYLIGGIDYFGSFGKDLPAEMLFHFLPSWNILYGTKGFSKLMMKRLSELFVPSVYRDIAKKTIDMSLGIPIEKLEKIVPMEKEAGKIRLAYGGRLVAEKGIFDYLEIAEQLYSSGHPIEYGFYFVFDRWSENDDKIAPFKRPYSKIAVNAVPIEENYFAWAASSDLFICTAKYEAAALAFQEMLFLGVPGFFLDAPWVHGLVPDDYPYIYKSKSDLALGIRAFCKRLENGEAPVYDMSKTQDFIREVHSRSVCERKTADLLVNLSIAKREKKKIWRLQDLCD